MLIYCCRDSLPFQNFRWCCILLGILVITRGGLISSRRLSTLSTLFPQYHLCPLCFEVNHRPTSCFTTPRYTQCIASIAMPLTMSKLGNFNKGLGALIPQTCKRNVKFRSFPNKAFRNKMLTWKTGDSIVYQKNNGEQNVIVFTTGCLKHQPWVLDPVSLAQTCVAQNSYETLFNIITK